MPRELVDRLQESKWMRAQKETWGHLKARPGAHRGYMVFALGEYGEAVSIVSSFSGVSGSPWFYQSHMDFIREHASESGTLYVFVGEYHRKKGDDCGRFLGRVTEFNPEYLLSLLPINEHT